ncbi:unnamed protein product [Blepharisma stoltei]|uniref:PAS domain-containing protein n=1 Tax=Blepharisma stoltei TaxID=1481888 RepID=A0AAU9ICQ1_9CILI|nr:unnamed protein product [Blepharisma stoltei]
MNDESGILIISGELDNFGHVLFANSRASKIMKTSISSLEEINIMNFIHPYYWKSLKEEMQWHIHYGSSSEIDLTKGFFLNIPGKHLIECAGRAIITSIENNAVFILSFQLNKPNLQTALLTGTGEILCYSEHFSLIFGEPNENLIGYNIKDLSSEADIYSSGAIYQLKNRETVLIISHVQFHKLNVFSATLKNKDEQIQRWKNENSDYKEKKLINKHLLVPEEYKRIARHFQITEDKNINSKIKLIETNSNEESEVIEINSFSRSSDAKSQYQSQQRYLKILAISSRSINIFDLAFILSIIAVLATNIVVLFYAFSYINFIKYIDFPMAIAKAESRLQIAAYTAQLLWVITAINDPANDQDLKAVQSLLPGHIDDIRDIYMDIAAGSSRWNYCSSKKILTEKNINVWDSGHAKKESLLDMLAQSAQKGYDLINKYNNAEDYTNGVKFLMMNGYGDGFQYINSSLYEVMNCQKSLMLDFKSEMLALLILGIWVLSLCLCFMVPFGYSLIKIENDLWNNLRKKAFQNYSELKHSLLGRLKSVYSEPEILISNKSPSKTIVNFKNYWKYIWRIFIYFMMVEAFSLINITYLYENCTNYLAYRPEVIRELIGTKIVLNAFIIATTDLQYDVVGFPLNYLMSMHNYPNNQETFQNSISWLKDAKLILRNPKYRPILSNNYEKMIYESDGQPYTHYLDYGAYSAEQELINSGYLIADFDVTGEDTYRNWVYNITLSRNNYDKYISEIDTYSHSVIEDQVNIIVGAFYMFLILSHRFWYILCFISYFSKMKSSICRE